MSKLRSGVPEKLVNLTIFLSKNKKRKLIQISLCE